MAITPNEYVKLLYTKKQSHKKKSIANKASITSKSLINRFNSPNVKKTKNKVKDKNIRKEKRERKKAIRLFFFVSKSGEMSSSAKITNPLKNSNKKSI